MKVINFFLFSLFLFFPMAVMAEIPQAVSITKINVSGSMEENEKGSWNVDIKDNRVVYQENIYAGQRQAVVSSIDYNLEFWNVGEEGGKAGMLWWKKDHGLATLIFNYNFAGPGMIIKKGGKFGELQGYKFEDAGSEPDVDPVVYKFRFSGGPNGKFTEVEPYKSIAGPATGRVLNGNSVDFDFPRQDYKEHPYLLIKSSEHYPWNIQGNPFFGYEMDNDGPCGGFITRAMKLKSWELFPAALARDSGARFSDFTGEVTVHPQGDPADLRPAELDMVLDVGSVIQTEEDSCAIISFADMSTFIMKPFSKVILETPPDRESKITLLTGRIWVNVKRMVTEGTLNVTMNQAIAGTRGTIFVAEEDGTNSTIKVIEGLMNFKSLASEEETDLPAGEQATVDISGQITKTSLDSASESLEWDSIKDGFQRADKESQEDNAKAFVSKKNKFAPFVGVATVLVIILALVVIKKEKNN